MGGGEKEDPGFKGRQEEVVDRIARAARRAGRDPTAVKLIAVTKAVPVERLPEALACGCRAFGESRIQEALVKMDALGAYSEIEWHLIGPLQSNKVKGAAGRFALIQSVDRLEAAERLDAETRKRKLIQPVLLEVNVAGEATKHGFAPEELVRAAERIAALGGLRVLGLMAIPPAAAEAEAARPHFRRVRELADQVEARGIPGVSMKDLSMGMSGDFEIAVEEGATMVRIGTALFGPRPEKRSEA